MISSAAGIGRDRQSQIYRDGVVGARPAVPTDFATLQEDARKALSPKAWAYVAGGAGEGRTMRNNREAFDRWAIVPRMLSGAHERNLATTLIDTTVPFPMLLAPVGPGN